MSGKPLAHRLGASRSEGRPATEGPQASKAQPRWTNKLEESWLHLGPLEHCLIEPMPSSLEVSFAGARKVHEFLDPLGPALGLPTADTPEFLVGGGVSAERRRLERLVVLGVGGRAARLAA